MVQIDFVLVQYCDVNTAGCLKIMQSCRFISLNSLPFRENEVHMPAGESRVTNRKLKVDSWQHEK